MKFENGGDLCMKKMDYRFQIILIIADVVRYSSLFAYIIILMIINKSFSGSGLVAILSLVLLSILWGVTSFLIKSATDMIKNTYNHDRDKKSG